MGCTPSLAPLETRLETPSEATKPRSMIKIQFLDELPGDKGIEGTTLHETENQTSDNQLLKQFRNESMAQKEHKIEFLKQSKKFMNISIETSTFVSNALMALSANPLLYDHSYAKLIGANKKILAQKQNRFNYLSKKEEKIENQLKRERELCIKKVRSQYFTGSQHFHLKKAKTLKPKDKQNKSESQLILLSKQRFSERIDKIEGLMLVSKNILQ